MTTFSDGLYQWDGVPVGNGFLANSGSHWFVRPLTGSDESSGKAPALALKTLTAALGYASFGDVIYLINETATSPSGYVLQSSTLDWNKHGVHLVAVNNFGVRGNNYTLAQTSTSLTVNTLLKVSASACYFYGINVFQGVASSTSVSPIALEVTGSNNLFDKCKISGVGNAAMDVAGGRSLKINGGGGNLFRECTIGYTGLIRGTATAEVEIAGAAARNEFERCSFHTYTSQAGYLMATVASTMDRYTIFRDCEFIAVQNVASAVAPTAVFDAAALAGEIHLIRPYLSGFTNYTAADAARVKALGLNGLATGHLIGVSQAIDVV